MIGSLPPMPEAHSPSRSVRKLAGSALAEFEGLQSADEAATWTHRSLARWRRRRGGRRALHLGRSQYRTTLIGVAVGERRQSHLKTLLDDLGVGRRECVPGGDSFGARVKSRANRSVRALGKTVRLRDKEHRKFVSRQPCLVCGRVPSDYHHLRFVQPPALRRRVSDEFTVPLHRIHHRELHRQGDEAAWWSKLSIDPVPVALKLWQHTRPMARRSRPVVAPSLGLPLQRKSPARPGRQEP
jgi:hypothetical protein